jgi:hypothetical protein
LNELPDDLAAKITVHYYLDARDAFSDLNLDDTTQASA